MNRIAELRADLDALKKEGGSILDRAVDDVLSEEDDAAFAAIEEKITAKKAEIEAAEKLAERRKAVTASKSVPAFHNAVNDPNPERTFGFKSMAEFGVAVRNASGPGGSFDDRLMAAAPTSPHKGGGSAGEGFMVPPDFRDEVWEQVSNMDNIINRTDLETTNARQVEAGADVTTPWGSTGVQAYWRSEASQMTESQLDTEGRVITLHEVYAFVTATDELLEDAPRLQGRLGRKSAEAISWKVDDAIINGNGAGKPQGWFTSASLVTVAKESGQAAATIDDQNILKMYSRLLRIPGDTPFWLVNPDTIPQLAAITIGDQPVWLPNNSMAGSMHGTLLGYPVILSEHAKTLGTTGDIHLVSPKGYHALRRTSGMNFASSMHLFFDYATTAFRWTFRFGGQPYLNAAISPANGSSTKSHFVALATRS